MAPKGVVLSRWTWVLQDQTIVRQVESCLDHLGVVLPNRAERM